MADYIDRGALRKKLAIKHFKVSEGRTDKKYIKILKWVVSVYQRVIDDMPSVDAVEVVRRKDCKYYAKLVMPDNEEEYRCQHFEPLLFYPHKEYYCASGVKKNEIN